VKLPLTICSRIKISGVIKISLIAKANLAQVMEYFDVYSQYNQLKIAILGVPLYCTGKPYKQLINQKIKTTTNCIVVL